MMCSNFSGQPVILAASSLISHFFLGISHHFFCHYKYQEDRNISHRYEDVLSCTDVWYLQLQLYISSIKESRNEECNEDTRKPRPHPPAVFFCILNFFPGFANLRRKRFVTLQLLSGDRICTMSFQRWEKASGAVINQDRGKT